MLDDIHYTTKWHASKDESDQSGLYENARILSYRLSINIHIAQASFYVLESDHRRSTFGPTFLFYHYLFFSFSPVLRAQLAF